MSRLLSLRTMDCGELGAVRSQRRARGAPASSSPTRRECFPSPVRGYPAHGVPPSGPHPLLIRRFAAVPLPLASGTEAPRAVRLPCQTFVSTSAICERRSSSRLLIDGIQNQCHGAGEGGPFRLLGRKLSTPERRQTIEPGPLAFL